MSVTAAKNVSADEPHFSGHFPGNPIMPGVLIIEAMAQAGGILSHISNGNLEPKPLYVLARVEDARFRRQVIPGDRLLIEVAVEKVKRGMWWYRCTASVDDQQVASAVVYLCTGRSRELIHSTAIISDSAKIADDVEIGPYSIIGDNVEIGAGSKVDSHVVINGPSVIGKDNHIYQFASVGDDPQDKKYAGEPTTLAIGDRNTIREFCTVSRGTTQDKGETIVGDDNWIMAYVHIAHDCIIGNQTIMANNATLGWPRARR